jgi:hypothetical protein
VPRLFLKRQGGRDETGQQGSVSEGSQLHQPDAIAIQLKHFFTYPLRHPRFSAAPCARQGHELRIYQELLDLGKIRTTSNKRSGVRTKIRGCVWYAEPRVLAALSRLYFLVGPMFRRWHMHCILQQATEPAFVE